MLDLNSFKLGSEFDSNLIGILVSGRGRLRRVVRAADMVHREAGPGVRRRLHPRRADHRLHHRLHRPP